jgi:hypothetical protein
MSPRRDYDKPATRAAAYRARADQANEAAAKIRDPEARRIYEDIARQWRELAEQIERHCMR